MLKVIGWIDYDDFNFATAEGSEEEINAVVKNIKENGYKFGGDDHENHSYCCPVLSNGKALRLSWRSWGAVMAMAYELKTKDEKYNYSLWYMGEYGPEKRVFPPQNKIDLDLVEGILFKYVVSEDELHALNNCCFTVLVLPYEFFEKNKLSTFDLIAFEYNGKVLLEAKVNECRFGHFKIDELFKKDDILDAMSANSNFKDFDEAKLKKFIIDKYNINDDRLITICFDIFKDNREDLNFD